MYLPRFTLVIATCSALALSAVVRADDAVELPPMVVTAAGHAQDAREAPASIAVITREQLEERRVGSLAEALAEVEGVDVGAPAGKTGGLNVSIRGMPSDYTLVLIDGRRQNTAGNVMPNGFGETQTNFMPPVAAIERIEVIRGPMATLYGSDAIGGVINIITRKVADAWTGSVTAEATVNEDRDYGDSRAFSLYTSGPLVKDLLGLQLRGRVFDRDASDLRFTDAAGNPVEVTKRGPSPVKGEIYSLGGRLSFTPNADHELWLDAEHTDQAYDNSEGQLGTLWDPGDSGDRGGYDTELGFKRTQVALGHTAQFAFGELRSSISNTRTENEGREVPPGLPDAGVSRRLETENLIVDTQLVAPIGEAHVATVGAQWWDAELIDGLVPDTMEQTMWSVFAEDEWLLVDDLALTLGGRYDDHDAFGGHFSPRAYLVWSATDNWTFKGGVSSAYRTPRLEQLGEGLVGYGGQGTTPLYGNPDLTPETSRTLELAAAYDSRAFGGSISLFYNDFEDKIGSVACDSAAGSRIAGCAGQTVGNTYINVDEAVTRGVELAARVVLARAWTLSANYTYTDSEQKSGDNEGEPLTDTPEHLVNAILRWQASDDLSAWLRGEYASERYRSRVRQRGAPSYADLGDYKAYTLVHLGANYRISDRVSVAAAVYNLLDKDFVDFRPYQADGDTEYGNVYANIEPGRRLWLSTTVSF